jgi:hypothetical protein
LEDRDVPQAHGQTSVRSRYRVEESTQRCGYAAAELRIFVAAANSSLILSD